MDYHYLLLYHAPQIYGECVNIGPQIYRNSQRTWKTALACPCCELLQLLWTSKILNVLHTTIHLIFTCKFYCWWITIMYLNDAKPDKSFNRLLYTQIFFNITDLYPALSLYLLLPRGARISPRLLNISLSIAFVHIILSLWDQGLSHLMSLKGALARDIMFVVSDSAALAVFLKASYSAFLKDGFRVQITLCFIWISVYLVIKTWAGYDEWMIFHFVWNLVMGRATKVSDILTIYQFIDRSPPIRTFTWIQHSLSRG